MLKLKIFSLLMLISLVSICCTPVSALYIWNVNDPNSCPLEAEIGEPIIIRGDSPPQYNVVVDSSNATDEQIQLVDELRDSEITMGEFLRIVNPHIWDGLTPEDQMMYDGYAKAWGAVDPVQLPPWQEPWEAVPSGDDVNRLNGGIRLEKWGYSAINENPFLSSIRSTSSFGQYDLYQIRKDRPVVHRYY